MVHALLSLVTNTSKKMARVSNNFNNIAFTLADHHQFRKCWMFSGPNAITAEANIVGQQNSIFVSTLPSSLQSVLDATFMIRPEHQVLYVKSVHLDCLLLVEREMYVIDIVTKDDIPILLQISHILQHEGTWIVCGFMNTVEQYNRLLDSYTVQASTEYTAVSPNEIISTGPIATNRINNSCQLHLPYRISKP